MLPFFPRPLEPLRQRRSALRPLVHWSTQGRVADFLGVFSLTVRQRAARAGGSFEFIVAKLGWHVRIVAPRAARVHPVSAGARD